MENLEKLKQLLGLQAVPTGAQQQVPMQGTTPNPSPFTPADEQYLLETLTECRAKLSMALKTAQTYAMLPELATGISDALTAIHEAAAVVIDPENYLE